MKRIIMLLGICFCISGVYAQKFEAAPLDEQGDVYEIKIRQFNKLFGKWFTAERVAEPTDGDAAQRSVWRDSCAVKLLTPELKEILKEAADKGGGSFWIAFYCDSDGKIQTVTFTMSSSVYVNLPNKILQELYRRAMDIVMNPGYYKFDGEHDYAIDTIELMQRV
ncbi:MAG TPA: hypothetical protein K8V05_04900 [Butyricimonas virosa]|uniref:Uncharacterized protein n=1 Tax=Butyricimonas virosa TaxID=544645 RepID=A0A921H5A0_9BACT|nr:hypothetical protein [Butyricimonas virosa]